MGSLLNKNKLQIIVLLIFLLSLLIPSLILCAGYQEEKLFDGDFYSSEELIRKIEIHHREIQVIANQIKVLETDIDWLVLKINQIQDSGRTADINLKKTITGKETIINTLLKTKNRLEYLVEYYSAKLDPEKEQTLEKILKKNLSDSGIKKKILGKKAEIKVKNITPKEIVSKTGAESIHHQGAKDSDEDNAISKIQLQNAVNRAGLNDWVEISGTGTCLQIETTLPILFPTGSAKIANEYRSFLQKLASFLKPYDVRVHVNGYADKVPIHNKKYPSNFELGAARAANIVHQLVNHGLKPSIFKIESTGRYRFAAKETSKQKNLERRAEVIVVFSG